MLIIPQQLDQRPELLARRGVPRNRECGKLRRHRESRRSHLTALLTYVPCAVRGGDGDPTASCARAGPLPDCLMAPFKTRHRVLRSNENQGRRSATLGLDQPVWARDVTGDDVAQPCTM